MKKKNLYNKQKNKREKTRLVMEINPNLSVIILNAKRKMFLLKIG